MFRPIRRGRRNSAVLLAFASSLHVMLLSIRNPCKQFNDKEKENDQDDRFERKVNISVNVDALLGARGARGRPVQPSYFNRSCHE